jgi:hypothetical protein
VRVLPVSTMLLRRERERDPLGTWLHEHKVEGKGLMYSLAVFTGIENNGITSSMPASAPENSAQSVQHPCWRHCAQKARTGRIEMDDGARAGGTGSKLRNLDRPGQLVRYRHLLEQWDWCVERDPPVSTPPAVVVRVLRVRVRVVLRSGS